MKRIATLACTAAIAIEGCGAKSDDLTSSPPPTSTIAPGTFGSPASQDTKWILTNKTPHITNYTTNSAQESVDISQSRTRTLESKVSTLTVEELADKLRPIMLGVDDKEYTVTANESIKLAIAVKNGIAREEQLSAPSEDPTGPSNPNPFVQDQVSTNNTGVFNGESRNGLGAYDYIAPWRMVAALLNSCTAFKMVNHYTAITAAHCVYGSSGWKRSSIKFAAGSTYYNALPSTCYAITVPNGWVTDVGDDEYDYAVIRLREGGTTGAWCNYADYNTGYFGYQGVSSCSSGIAAAMAGYPSKSGPGLPPPGSWTYPNLFWDYREDGWTSCITYPNHVWYYNDNSGGQSGGPYFSWIDNTIRVRAVNMAIFNGLFSDSNGGRRIDSQTVNFFTAYAGY